METINDSNNGKTKSKYMKTNIEQMEKKLKSWNTTRAIKVEQAKRIVLLNEKLERRVLYLNMLVVLLAILSFSTASSLDNELLTSFSLAYSILIILLQNYISKLNLDSQIKEFKLLEVNLDLIINELESLYRKYCRLETDEKKYHDEVFCVQIENLTNKYNMYLQNIPLHNNEDYNNSKTQQKEHVEKNKQSKLKYKYYSYIIANLLVITGCIPLVIEVGRIVLNV